MTFDVNERCQLSLCADTRRSRFHRAVFDINELRICTVWLQRFMDLPNIPNMYKIGWVDSKNRTENRSALRKYLPIQDDLKIHSVNYAMIAFRSVDLKNVLFDDRDISRCISGGSFEGLWSSQIPTPEKILTFSTTNAFFANHRCERLANRLANRLKSSMIFSAVFGLQ